MNLPENPTMTNTAHGEGVRIWDGTRGCPNCDVPPGHPHSSICPRVLTDLLNRCEQCRSNGQTCSGACTPGVPRNEGEQHGN